MFLSNPRFILAIVATSSFIGLPSVNAQPFLYAGYSASTNVDATAARDLIQKEFELQLDGGSCAAVGVDGKNYYNSQAGKSLKKIPTYADTKSPTWDLYEAYYGDEDYYNQWVTRALKGKTYKFAPNGKAKFGRFEGNIGTNGACVGRQECSKKGTAYLSGYLEIFQFLEQAVNLVDVDNCIQQETGCSDAVIAWNKGAAYWIGSLEGTDGINSASGDYGKQLYALADKRCDDYSTCGRNGNTENRNEPAKVNIVLVSLFQKGLASIYAGDTESAKKTIEEINSQLTVATIQGTLRYAYRLGQGSVEDKEIAEGATFGAAAFPQLWKCDTQAAIIAQKEMEIGSNKLKNGNSNFEKVLDAFQCNYECLGISCDEVGALFDGDPAPPKVPACVDRADTCLALTQAEEDKCNTYTSNPNPDFS